MDIITVPWHWAFSGFMITVVSFLLLYLGKRFGVSSSFRALCAVGGAGKKVSYFNYDWKSHQWLFVFVLGSVIGGLLASQFMHNGEVVQISQSTISDLAEIGVLAPAGETGLLPESIFNFENLMSIRGFVIMVLGGFLIGFGTRWAGGCTSGHAISGLSELQLPSLVAVIGFFIGGLLMTHLLFPLIMQL